ncbi:class I glutamine amidotransferase-like protein [Russula ochroleuca]|uniref:D-lactate dehydratase n=1 Tax=Russula ochroleuca TaxID=152965 RepID=A0A9P5T9K8_9AGAM|nr:class I glutamine amidotransferase-like protein [Russula ochroleuca]
MPSALILVANGTEEMEFTIIYDTLVRAGVKCTSALVTSPGHSGHDETEPGAVQCSRGVRIVPDASLSQLSASTTGGYDAIIIPGGLKGAETISQSSLVQSLVRSFYESKKLVGMICAASLVAKTSQLPRQPLTSHPSVKDQLDKDFEYREDSVVISGNLITSRGPGTAFPFAFALVENLCGAQKRSEVIPPMVFPPGTPL